MRVVQKHLPAKETVLSPLVISPFCDKTDFDEQFKEKH